MSTTEETPAMTAEDHVREAQRYAASAGEDPAIYTRSVDLQAAQVHATLAQTLKAAELVPLMAKIADWIASGEPDGKVAEAPETTP